MAQPQGGEAMNYYNDSNAPPGPPPNQHKEGYGNGGGYGQQAPPQYDMSYGPQSYEATGEKLDFNQAFKVEKPKWNDLWAGLLVCLFILFVCLYFSAVAHRKEDYSLVRILIALTDFEISSSLCSPDLSLSPGSPYKGTQAPRVLREEVSTTASKYFRHRRTVRVHRL